MALVYALLAIGALVALHEAGHMLLARAFGMRVDRYSIGFGPVLLAFKRGQTEYALSMLPFGGYVKIAGMNPHDGTAEGDPASYASKPAWQRFIVIAAGPITNYLLTFALLAALFTVGLPKALPTPTIGEVTPSSAAAQAGLKPDDEILAVNGQPVADFGELRKKILQSQGQPLALHLRREGHELDLTATPRLTDGAYLLGATQKTRLEQLPLGQAIVEAAQATALANVAILTTLANGIRYHQLQVGGTVEVVAQTSDAAKRGARDFFVLLAQISVFLALFNLLPVPALDGGRLFFLLVEMVRRRPVDQKLETMVHAMGFLVLLGLMAVLTVKDVHKRLRPAGEAPPPAPAATADAGP